ncbi:hypothetical protein LAD54_17095 [Klebsiella pneumoniae]|nr:hypothetical protein [Klebsiella pneumoniae]
MRFINFYDSDKNIFVVVSAVNVSLRLHRQRMVKNNHSSFKQRWRCLSPERSVLQPVEDYVHVMRKALPDVFQIRFPGVLLTQNQLDIDFVKAWTDSTGKNLFNSEPCQSGYIMNRALFSLTHVTCTQIIFPLNSARLYALRVGARFITFYNASKTFIRTECISTSGTDFFVTDSEIA